MIRQWLGSGVLVVAMAALAACGGGTPPGQDQTETEVASPEDSATSPDAPADDSAGQPGNAGSRVQQCNRLIDVINGEQNEIRNASTDDATAMRGLAGKLDGVVEHVREVPLSDPSLKDLKQRYIRLIADFADTARLTADAMDAKDLDKLKEAQRRLKLVGPAESQLVSDINHYCQDK